MFLALYAPLQAWLPTPDGLPMQTASSFPAAGSQKWICFGEVGTRQGDPSGNSEILTRLGLARKPVTLQITWSQSRLDSIWLANFWSGDVSLRGQSLGSRLRIGFEQQQSPGWNASSQWSGLFGASVHAFPSLALGIYAKRLDACTQEGIAIQWRGGDSYQMEMNATIHPRASLALTQALQLSSNLTLGMSWQTNEASLALAIRWGWDHFAFAAGERWHSWLSEAYGASLFISSQRVQP